MPDICPHVMTLPPRPFVAVDGMLIAWPWALRLAEEWRRQGETGNECAGMLADRLALAIIEAQQEAIRCPG